MHARLRHIERSPRTGSSCAPRTLRSTGVTIVELLVVVGVISALLALLIGGVSRLRERSKATACSSNLSQIGKALNAYAVDHKGYVPRYARTYDDPAGPVWLAAIARYVGAPANWKWEDLPRTVILQCPSHPTPEIPSAYVLNCFAFETSPDWFGAPPTLLRQVRKPADVFWVLEATDYFRTYSLGGGVDDIFLEPYHVVREPANLPGKSRARIHMQRHRPSSNVLFADGHVDAVTPRELVLGRFDDGFRGGRGY